MNAKIVLDKASIKSSQIAALLVVLLLCMPVAVAQGQQISIGKAIGEALAKSMGDQLIEAATRRITVHPGDKAISSSDTLVTLTLINTYKDTLEASMHLYTSPPERVMMESKFQETEQKPVKKSIIADEQPEDSTGTLKDLSPWIKEFPRKVTLGPGDTTQIQVLVKIPNNVEPGEYVVWFATQVKASVQQKESPKDPEVKEGNVGVRVKTGGAGFKPGTVFVDACRIIYKSEI